MSLKLYFHPLSSFCQKVLVALYENDTPFEPQIVDLGDAASSAELKTLWPIGKFPVLRDETRGETIPESSVIIEYLDRHHPGATRFIPADPGLAQEVRLRDRFFDLHIHLHMQKIVGDRLRPAGRQDPHGVEDARTRMATALNIVERAMSERSWAIGETFTLADCAAAPALFYADKVAPFRATHRHAAAYLDRLMQRPSYARALREAEPYFQFFPQE